MQLTFHATGAPDNVTLNSLNTLTFWDLKKAADSLEAFLVNFCNLAAEQQCWESGGFSTISLKI